MKIKMISGFLHVLQGKSSSGSIASSSAVTPSPSPSPCSTQYPGFTCITSEVNEHYQSLSSPSSAEVSSMVVSNNVMDHLDSACVEDFSKSHTLEISKALKRLEEQLSLNDDTIEELDPFAFEDEHSNSSAFLEFETEVSIKGQYGKLLDGSESSMNYQFPGERNCLQDNGTNYVALQDIGIIFIFLSIWLLSNFCEMMLSFIPTLEDLFSLQVMQLELPCRRFIMSQVNHLRRCGSISLNVPKNCNESKLILFCFFLKSTTDFLHGFLSFFTHLISWSIVLCILILH